MAKTTMLDVSAWLTFYASREEVVWDAWSTSAHEVDGAARCRAAWRALGLLDSIQVDAKEFEATLSEELRVRVPTSWEEFVGHHNRLIDARARLFEEQFEWQQELGEGGFATVYMATYGESDYALKVVEKEASPRKLAVLETEWRVWTSFPAHDNIVRALGVFELPSRTVVVTELCEGGCLMDRLLECEHFGENAARMIARQVASAIWHLHDHGVAHRDIKPDNVLCTHPQPHLHGVVKLCDFGLAGNFNTDEEAYLTKLAGSRARARTPPPPCHPLHGSANGHMPCPRHPS
jgi:serine/threonine protein kinase